MYEHLQERNRQITAMRKSGIGPREIARRLSLSPSLVAGILYRASLTAPSSSHRRHAPAFRESVLESVPSLGARGAAREWGIAWSTMCRWRRDASARRAAQDVGIQR